VGRKLVEYLEQTEITLSVNSIFQSLQTAGLVLGQVISFKAKLNPEWGNFIFSVLFYMDSRSSKSFDDEFTASILRVFKDNDLSINAKSDLSLYSRLCTLKGILVNINPDLLLSTSLLRYSFVSIQQ
jgi:hypothetical protein